jgi:hypothetical protein
MAEPPIDIERVVREVLAQLGVAPQTGAAPAGPASGSPSAAVPQEKEKPQPTGETGSSASGGEIVLQRRVVTLADLPERLEGVRRVAVPPKAVVTPAVHDELRKRHIHLVYAEPQPGKAPGRAPVTIVSMGSPWDPAPLIKALESEGLAVQSQHVDCLVEATDRLAKDLAGGQAMGVLLTRHAAAGLCLANRLAGVRAIRGSSTDAVAAEAEAVGANLLVLDPSAIGLFTSQQIVLRFLRGGPRQCPAVFRKRLG